LPSALATTVSALTGFSVVQLARPRTTFRTAGINFTAGGRVVTADEGELQWLTTDTTGNYVQSVSVSGRGKFTALAAPG
jgi:hypothetical protein